MLGVSLCQLFCWISVKLLVSVIRMMFQCSEVWWWCIFLFCRIEWISFFELFVLIIFWWKCVLIIDLIVQVMYRNRIMGIRLLLIMGCFLGWVMGLQIWVLWWWLYWLIVWFCYFVFCFLMVVVVDFRCFVSFRWCSMLIMDGFEFLFIFDVIFVNVGIYVVFCYD